MQRVTITLDDDLLETLDSLSQRRGYNNRSEAIRDILRGALSQGLDLLYISAGIHARDYMTGDITDEAALVDFLADHQAEPRWWMPRLK